MNANQNPIAVRAVSSLFQGVDETLAHTVNLLARPTTERCNLIIRQLLELPLHGPALRPLTPHPRSAQATKIIIATMETLESFKEEIQFLEDLAEVSDMTGNYTAQLKATAGLTLFARPKIVCEDSQSESSEKLLQTYAKLLANCRLINLEDLSEYWHMPTEKHVIEKIGHDIAVGLDNGAGRQMLSTLEYVSLIPGMQFTSALAEIVKMFAHKAVHRMRAGQIPEMFGDLELHTDPFAP